MIKAISSYNQMSRINIQESKSHQKNEQEVSFKSSSYWCSSVKRDFPAKVHKNRIRAVISGIVSLFPGAGILLANKFDNIGAELICGELTLFALGLALMFALFARGDNKELKKCS